MEADEPSQRPDGMNLADNSHRNLRPALHIPPAPQQPNADGEFRCGICNKTYSRRDLRDRHRRRCIKTIGQERQSKRKSCETCAQKKLRCSMTRPACSRCIQIRTPCRYPPSAIPVQPSESNEALISSTTSTSTASLLSVSPAPSAPTGSASDEVSPAAELQTRPMPTSNPFDPITSGPWSPFSSGDMDLMVHQFPNTPLFPDPDILAPGTLPWNNSFSPLSESLMQEGDIIMASLSSNQPSDSPTSRLPLQNGLPTSVPHDVFQIASDLSISSLPSRVVDSSIIDRNTHGGTHNYPYIEINPENSSNLDFGGQLIVKPGVLAPYEVQEIYQAVFSALRQYPSLVLQRDRWSPFIHHQMYRCSVGGMAEPMGIALACVSAHAGSIGSNYGFVDAMIMKEREKLVRNFQSYLNGQENCLAAVHAVCIYQILGLFGDNFLPAAIKSPPNLKEMLDQQQQEVERQAELHTSFLLKMTRRLYNHHRDALQVDHDAETSWERWKFLESLRRNIFLVHIINVIGAKSGKLNGVYCEPLDDDMILQLPLPAPECMWRACSAREWSAAREYLRQHSTPPKGQDGRTAPVSQTLRRLLHDEETGTLNVSTLLPLTRVIFASTKIEPPGLSHL
ncbi:hypothetical protein AOCH_004198 [Aspergillus ochraceoroseus]|uniref:Zn(2)-C6 fungal-type domain-containing protein n=2 Tax=Aspergillus ochraceoroseus TaxID=138278 RepID=A0A0F8X2K4_9EURO|nr:hypothetical protein AOCH_004198 [Aspergillus ochraceoroseus]